MSAFLCNGKLFNEVVSTLYHYAENKPRHAYGTGQAAAFMLNVRVKDENGNTILRPTANEQMAVIAKQLYNMNRDAVSQRYKDGSGGDYGYQFRQTVPLSSMVVLFKKIQCLSYQCSEGDVPERDLFKKMEKVLDALAHDIVCHLKEYDKAIWG